MPGWHALTKRYEDQGRLKVVGIIQEQHSDRAQLFMQWKKMGWPLLVDSLNLLGVTGAPITLFLDEAGVIKAINPRREALVEFLGTVPVERTDSRWSAPSRAEMLGSSVSDELTSAERQFLWGGLDGLARAISSYRKVLLTDSSHAKAQFRLGVVYRRRYDSERRETNDFGLAVEHWGKALDLNPNQYIWRRRIQQYGPRLSKPYSFYDWVHKARTELSQQGIRPISLTVEPGGAEFAHPSARFEVGEASLENPDPEGRIFRDSEGLVKIESVAVPSRLRAGEAVRIHIRMAPDEERKVHWNNEVEALKLWTDGVSDWPLQAKFHQHSAPEQPVSVESRKIEFEMHVPQGTVAGVYSLRGFVLYYICEDVAGQCLFRRQDFDLPVHIVD